MTSAGSSTLFEAYRRALSKEEELILCYARRDLTESTRRRGGRLLEEALDWTRLSALAERHALRPLLYRHFSALGSTRIPKPLFVGFWAHYERTRRRNAVMAKALVEVLGTLKLIGIAAIAYKGPALAQRVFGDVGLREFGDLDILIRPTDVLPAKRALQAAGYVAQYELKPEVEAAFLDSALNYHLVLLHKADEVMVELHWKTDADFPVERIDDPSWWQTCRQDETLDGEPLISFNEEDLLLILLLHGTKHAWSSLGWLVDVAELVRQNHDTLDWDRMTGRAGQLGCPARAGVGLLLAAHLLEAPVPDRIRREAEALPQALRGAERILPTLFGAGIGGMNAFQALRFNLGLYEGAWKKVTHSANVLMAPNLHEWSRWPLPRYLHAAYLPLRLCRLLAKYGEQALSRR